MISVWGLSVRRVPGLWSVVYLGVLGEWGLRDSIDALGPSSLFSLCISSIWLLFISTFRKYIRDCQRKSFSKM